ncbi:MAG: hypothetical protein NVSMB26_06040 [Beijerinckiaceae bacterium]
MNEPLAGPLDGQPMDTAEFARKHKITEQQAAVLIETVGPGIFDFDEALYIEENPDVRQSLAYGEFASAMHFFYLHGRHEGRSGGPEYVVPEAMRFKGPIPPQALRKRVHGHTQLCTFEAVGATVCTDILRAVADRLALTADKRVLDFGCGCGRVIVYLRHAVAAELVGTDIDAEAIAWCERNLASVGTFSCNNAMPPLAFPDDSFDLTYAISVFTHLPERMQDVWLQELARVTKAGGYLLLTTNDRHAVRLSKLRGLRFAMKGYLYVQVKTPGLPAFYGSAFHSESYIRRHWSRFFEIVEFKPKGVNRGQDLIVCRKRA